MKKLFLLLTMVAMLATACTEGGVDENDEPQNPTEQPGGGNNDGNDDGNGNGGNDDGNDDNTGGGTDDEKPTGGPISVSKGRVNVDFEGGDCELSVNAEYSWVATCSADWITLQTPDGIAGEEPLKFSVQRNVALSERKTTITLKNENYNLIQEVYVVQSKFAPVFETVESVSLGFAACEKFIEVTSNVAYDVITDADWLTCEVVEGGINLSATTNGALETRSAQVAISAKENTEAPSITISVVQSQFAPVIEAVNSVSLGGDACSKFIEVTSNVEYDVKVYDWWLTCELAEGGIKLYAKINNPDQSRSAKVTIFAKDNPQAFSINISVIQAPYEIRYVIYYTTTDGNLVHPKRISPANNIMTGNQGMLLFNGPVTEIREEAFKDCSNLESITIPDCVKVIGLCAFEGCTSLKSVTIPDSVTDIYSLAFEGCWKLARVDITDLSAWCKIRFVDSAACPLCYGAKLYLNGNELTNITNPSDITEIKDYAFYGCTSLKSITIGNSVTSIGEWAFSDCTSLTSATIDVARIEKNTFSRCTSLTNVTIGDSVSKIGGSAFEDCTSLKSITIGNSVTSIGDRAFAYCNNLTNVTIPDSVSWIGSFAFTKCTSIKNITIPASVKSMGQAVFSGVSGEQLIINSWSVISKDYPDDWYSEYGDPTQVSPLYGSYFLKVVLGDNGDNSAYCYVGQYLFASFVMKDLTIIPDCHIWFSDSAFYSSYIESSVHFSSTCDYPITLFEEDGNSALDCFRYVDAYVPRGQKEWYTDIFANVYEYDL